MFNISDKTRDDAVDAIVEAFKNHGIEATDAAALEAFEAAVAIVKKQFGL